MEKKHLLNHYLKKYRANEMSAEEFRDFIETIGKDELEYEKILDEVALKDWKPSKDILEQIRKEENHINRRISMRRWMWSSAAAIVLLCMAWFFLPQQLSGDLVYKTGFGETQNIELPDGSIVLLNANSSLTWKSGWEKTMERRATLDGEAFFDVTKVDNTPFEVIASGVQIKVLGTEFNVRNRGSDAEVFLHEGKVDLKFNSDKNRTIAMKPGDFVRYDKTDNTITIKEHEYMQKKAAWVDGMLEFENKKVGLILKEFEALYGKRFEIENTSLKDKRMDLSLPYADWELVRKALEIAVGAEFTTVQDTIFVK